MDHGIDLEKLRSDLIRDEGVRTHPYRCTAGALTVGVGHNLDAHPVSSEELRRITMLGATNEEIEAWLQEDMNSAINDAMQAVGLSWGALSESRKRVVANMAFNLGIHRLSGFRKFLAALRVGDFSWAAKEMVSSKWHNEVGDRAKRLVKMMLEG